MAAIKTEDLTKEFGGFVAVEDLNLTVREGEVFGFLGPNGAGKSTTINMLLDFIRPTEGNASVFGHDPRTESRAVRERIGILPEGYSLYDRLSAREHVEFAIEMEESDDDPDEILERVGLIADAERSVGGFSKGMSQRLALGLALVGDPDLLVLDEPSSGLDPAGAQELREIVRREANHGTTVFFSSHVLEQVEASCDRIGIMRDGGLVAVDTIEGLRESTGPEFTLVLTVDEVPDFHGLSSVDGVTNVTSEDSTLSVDCSDSSVKAEVISHVEETGVTVTDIGIEETSLEDLFTEYTSGKRETKL
jgi:ABC-2 type transport system ATP-binding protein